MKDDGKDKEGELEQKVELLKVDEKKSGTDEKKKPVKERSLKDKKKKLEAKTVKKDEIKNDHKGVIYASQHEQLLAENFYKSNVDYDNLFSYTFSGIKVNSFDVYENDSLANSGDGYENMDIEEAKETLVSIQYATVLGSMTEMSLEKRRQFATWVSFNKGLMNLFENLYGVTGDVDYSKTF